MPTRLQVLFLGDSIDEEFSPAVESLRPLVRLEISTDARTALQSLNERFAADVIVICQQRPGQWDEKTVEQLRRAAPLAPVIALMGSWCAAAARSGRTYAGVIHLPWHRWHREILPGFQQLLAGECPWWAWPPGDDERRLRLRPEATLSSRSA